MDLFINKLAEGVSIKNTDYTVFDVADTTTGSFNTQKISYESLTKQLFLDVSENLKDLIDALQSNIDTTNANVANKLDKRGLTFNSSERMTGTLFINAPLSAAGLSHFSNTLNVYNNFIQNVKDPVLDQDAVNKRTLTQSLNNLNIPDGNLFILKSGDTMTAGNLTLSAEPNIPKHATTKKYVDDQIAEVTNLINLNKPSNNFVALTGGVGATMTAGFITAPNTTPPSDDKHLTNKKYVDDQITIRTSGFITNTLASTLYVSKAGDTMIGSLILSGIPRTNNEASNKKYVDDRILDVTNSLGNYLDITTANATYLKKAGDTMTAGDLSLFRNPTQPKHATTMQWVTGEIATKTANYLSINAADSLYVKKAGDTMTGSLALKGFSERAGTSGATGNVTLDLNAGNTFAITLSGNITGFTFTNVPSDTFSVTIIITQTSTGGPYNTNFNFTSGIGAGAVTYTVKWANSQTPTITTIANKTDVFCFTRVNNIIYGFNGGQNF